MPPGAGDSSASAKIAPQLAQLHAHRRLAQVQAPGGARDASLRQQRVERDEQIEIDLAQIVHDYAAY
jgi:hypothetical protein